MLEERPIPLLPEIDERATIQKAKDKLKEYPVWREIACDEPIQRITQDFTFEPRGGGGPVSYTHLQVKDEQEAFDYWKLWEPSHNTKMEIKQLNGQTSLELVG